MLQTGTRVFLVTVVSFCLAMKRDPLETGLFREELLEYEKIIFFDLDIFWTYEFRRVEKPAEFFFRIALHIFF